MTHTKGPWQWIKHEDDKEAGPDNPGYLFAPDEPYSIANEHHPGEYLGVAVLHAIYPSQGDRLVRVTCRPDDAALIASAPDLLAALETETARCGFAEHDDGTSSCYVHAPNEDGNGCSIRNAIAKARGEAVSS